MRRGFWRAVLPNPRWLWLFGLLAAALLRGQDAARARQSLERGDHTRAEAELRDLLRGNPRAVEGHFLLGVLYVQKGDYGKAHTYLSRALELAPNSVSILNNLGVNALHRGQNTRATDYFQRALKLAPGDPGALYNLGLLEIKHGRYAQARDYLGRAASGQPGDLPTLQGLLLAHLQLGENEAAEATLGRIFELAPNNPGYYLQLAAPLVTKDHARAARTVLERAIALWPERAELHNALGDACESLGLFEKAVEAYQAAVHRDPDNEAWWFSLGREFLLHHNFDLAEKIFSTGAGRLPRASRLRIGLAAAYFSQTQYDKSIATLRQAIEADPRGEAGYFFLSRAFVLLADRPFLFDGEWLDASLQKYARLKPREAFPYYVQGLRLSRGSGSAEAARFLKKALTLDPRLAEAHLELGLCSFRERRFAEAITSFRKAVELRPGYVEAHYRMALAYLKIGDTAKAREAQARFTSHQQEQKAEASRRDKEILRFVYTLR